VQELELKRTYCGVSDRVCDCVRDSFYSSGWSGGPGSTSGCRSGSGGGPGDTGRCCSGSGGGPGNTGAIGCCSGSVGDPGDSDVGGTGAFHLGYLVPVHMGDKDLTHGVRMDGNLSAATIPCCLRAVTCGCGSLSSLHQRVGSCYLGGEGRGADLRGAGKACYAGVKISQRHNRLSGLGIAANISRCLRTDSCGDLGKVVGGEVGASGT